MKYLLDTNVCVDYLTGRFPTVIERMKDASPEDLAVSSIVAAELRYGADKSQQPVGNHARLDVLLSDLRCLDFDLAAARAYGALRSALERRGRSIGAHDMLIAAHALATNLILVTDNLREFGRIPRLTCENWRRR